jgi:hypothetical protein
VEDVWTLPREELHVKPLASSSSDFAFEKTIITLKARILYGKGYKGRNGGLRAVCPRRKQVAAVPPYLVETAAGQPL